MPTRDGRPLVVVPLDDIGLAAREAQAVLGDVAEVRVLPADGDERTALLGAADVLFVTAWKLRDEEGPLLRSLRLVQSVWAGVDRIPVARLAAEHPRVRFAGGSDANAPQVAEHALALYLDCLKLVTRRDRALRRGEWLQQVPGRSLAGQRVAVVGYGAIGRRLGRMLAALDVRVTAVNRTGHVEDRAAHAATNLAGLRARLGDHDGVVLTLPLTAKTRGLVDHAWLRAMPADGVLVNVARGKLVVEEDLYGHLVDHPGFTAGLDALWHYPKGTGAHHQGVPFHELENVVLTPHSAFNVPGVQAAMVRGAAANVRRWLAGGPLGRSVDAREH